MKLVVYAYFQTPELKGVRDRTKQKGNLHFFYRFLALHNQLSCPATLIYDITVPGFDKMHSTSPAEWYLDSQKLSTLPTELSGVKDAQTHGWTLAPNLSYKLTAEHSAKTS